MANQSIINNSKLDAIVAAIVAKGGGTAPMTADQMAAAIAAIPAGAAGTIKSIYWSVRNRYPTMYAI